MGHQKVPSRISVVAVTAWPFESRILTLTTRTALEPVVYTCDVVFEFVDAELPSPNSQSNAIGCGAPAVVGLVDAVKFHCCPTPTTGATAVACSEAVTAVDA